MTLHLTCAFQVVTLPNERVIALFHFFLQFLHIVEIDLKAHNTTTSRPPVPCILQILTAFNLYSGRPRVGLSVITSKGSDKQWLRFEDHPPPPPPLGQICQPKWLDHRRVKSVAKEHIICPDELVLAPNIFIDWQLFVVF